MLSRLSQCLVPNPPEILKNHTHTTDHTFRKRNQTAGKFVFKNWFLVVCSMGWHRLVDTPHNFLQILAEVDTLLEQDLDLMDSHLKYFLSHIQIFY